ncbi:MAG: DeoR/GlpR family DNA-binding transcription regulator [Lacrimispora sp.]|uniref:DeoR/GlpR family DNA-binding transcription regulator n=1 Tax=Lacrimispora sp. TaxID=2719234 RepID=UPI0039E68F2A
MFAEERHDAIVSLVNKKGSVRVKELSEKFDVTEDSIRKDLTQLEKKGLLKKTYGGAMKIRINVHDLDVAQRKDKNIEMKQMIARKALELIKDGDMVFLDISTANLELAKLLTKSMLRITVVTNMIDVMQTLTAAPTVKVIFIGGTFSRGHDGFVGSITIDQIVNYRFDIAFVGAVGVDLIDNSVATYMVEDGLTKSAVIEVSKKAYMMLETRKFNMDGTYKYAKVDSFTGAVMDGKPQEDIEEQMKEYDIEWIY